MNYVDLYIALYYNKYDHTSHFLFHAICETFLLLERSHLKLQRNGNDGNWVSKRIFVTVI